MALLERYSNPGGSGLQDGLTEANAWDIADVLKPATVAAAGQRVNHKGDYNALAGDIQFSLVATEVLPFLLQGYDTIPQDLENLVNTGLNPKIVIPVDNFLDLTGNFSTTFRDFNKL